VNWNHHYGGGPRLVVRTRGIEVSAPQGMMLERRSFFFSAETATMWRDRVGWAGTALGRKECIRLQFGESRRAGTDGRVRGGGSLEGSAPSGCADTRITNAMTTMLMSVSTLSSRARSENVALHR
jgi:hypothetical protein